MWNNGMALPALLFAPVTAAWGGLATVTVLVAVGLAGSATAAFGALRALGATTLPAALGGASFGFSPAMVVQSLGGHPNLVFNVLVPVLVLLAVRLAADERPRMRIAVLLGLLAAAQLLIGEEVLFLTGVVVGLLLLGLAAAHPATALRRAPRFLALAGAALGTFLLLGGPLLAFQLFGPLHQSGSPFPVGDFGVDLVNHVVPTAEQLIATPDDAARTLEFPGGPEEHGGYLGWPLLVVAAAALVLCRRRTRCGCRSRWRRWSRCSRWGSSCGSTGNPPSSHCRGRSWPGCPGSSTSSPAGWRCSPWGWWAPGWRSR